MCTQMTDSLHWQGKSHRVHDVEGSILLSAWTEDQRPKFRMPHTACHRGFIAHWEITGDGKLILKSIDADQKIEELFPGHTGAIHASWFNGVIETSHGQRLYRIGLYCPVYEHYRLLHIEGGVLVRVEDHGREYADPMTMGERNEARRKFRELLDA